jgi:hypothetical protein
MHAFKQGRLKYFEVGVTICTPLQAKASAKQPNLRLQM